MKILVLGSICLDMIVDIDELPKLNEDVNTNDLNLSLGGMAYNVYNVIKLFKEDVILGSVIGEGVIANIVSDLLAIRNDKPIGVIKGQDNGLCICLVDKSKERSFISHHGAEYRFNQDFFKDINFEEVSYIYVSGLEIEDVDGLKIIEFLEKVRKPIFFAPGPRVDKINPAYLKRLYDLKPILHINEREALLISNLDNLNEAVNVISDLIHNLVIVTLGEKGTLYKEYQKDIKLIETTKVEMLDATGAGDNHAGATLAMLNKANTVEESIKVANKVAAAVVKQKGASLDEDNFKAAINL